MKSDAFPVELKPNDHICEFYRTDLDLADTLIPYFKEGIERNESCVWITARPYEADRAVADIRKAIPDADRRIADGQLFIRNFDEWYVKDGAYDTEALLRSWLALKDEALQLGRVGLRISGNGSFLEPSMWDDFVAYERALDIACADQPITTLCSYSLADCSGDAVMDVLANHRLGLVKCDGTWRTVSRLDGVGVEGDVLVGSGLQEALAWYRDGHPLALDGPPVRVNFADAIRVNVAIGELARRSVKSGTFQRGERVQVRWWLESNGLKRLAVAWVEEGGSSLRLPDVDFSDVLLAANCDGFTRTSERGRTTHTVMFELRDRRLS